MISCFIIFLLYVDIFFYLISIFMKGLVGKLLVQKCMKLDISVTPGRIFLFPLLLPRGVWVWLVGCGLFAFFFFFFFFFWFLLSSRLEVGGNLDTYRLPTRHSPLATRRMACRHRHCHTIWRKRKHGTRWENDLPRDFFCLPLLKRFGLTSFRWAAKKPFKNRSSPLATRRTSVKSVVQT